MAGLSVSILTTVSVTVLTNVSVTVTVFVCISVLVQEVVKKQIAKHAKEKTMEIFISKYVGR
jgi:hypothetical protein